MVYEVLLPNWPMFHGRCLRESPRSTTHFSQSYFSTSAAMRAVPECENVPRLPTPVWMCSLPSGVMRTRPSKPEKPAG